MFKGKYTGEGNVNLDQGVCYYLFPLGESHYYVSKFNSVNAHVGAYRQSLFTVTEHLEDVPDTNTDIPLNSNIETNKVDMNIKEELEDLPPEKWEQISLF
ncbi:MULTISPECIES: hypothetical protein [Bacillus]|uniref:Uncharacterized protein n=1 Tax=Bacillus glycinifermentans TaxID=1664069 RepID=A0A0T6BI98_9BACI|nr:MULTISPECIES: hypothetical protein [Bacillus]KRT87078.1 hypothetical protein AB447_208915 [Bacillus glycinifermentans]MEC0341870.1 hypothetical protein [Bacillus sonorensis]MEC0457444.1 hypothetical protein [Bacillus sonorensis]MEC0487127.1 hypothetical protein [Bacillus glycinifermentans]MEC0530761.1 hypothetical protein [Bacillus sonorensis]